MPSISCFVLLFLCPARAHTPLGALADPLDPVLPALGHAVAILGRDQPHRTVEQCEARAAALGLQAVLISLRISIVSTPAGCLASFVIVSLCGVGPAQRRAALPSPPAPCARPAP